MKHDDDPPPPGPPEPSSVERAANPLVTGVWSVMLTLVVGSALVLVVLGLAGLLLSFVTDSPGPGIALVLLFLVLPVAAVILLGPSATIAVRLSSRGDQSLHARLRVGLIVACLLSWAVAGLLVGLAVDCTGELTPAIAVLARDLVCETPACSVVRLPGRPDQQKH